MSYASSVKSEVHVCPKIDDLGLGRHRSTPSRGYVRQIPQPSGHRHPYTYLVDVLQRIDTHPARDVRLLTPRLWKQHFAERPLRSAVDASPT
jgi:hypothetical protein